MRDDPEAALSTFALRFIDFKTLYAYTRIHVIFHSNNKRPWEENDACESLYDIV